jgi:hypothetical protein
MKKLFIIILLCVSMTAVAQNQIKRVAILEVVDKLGAVSYLKLLQFRSNLTSAITNTEGYEGYDRVDLEQIIGEQNFQRTGLVRDADIKKIGEFTGAQYVLIAEATLDGTDMFITAKIIDVESARVLRNSNQLMGISASEMQEGSKKVAADLLGVQIDATVNNATGDHKPILIYEQDKSNNQYCDGNHWETAKDYFSIDLDNLNRKHFRIKFSFSAKDYYWMNRGIRVPRQWVLTLSRGWRVMAICLHDNGEIYIEADNSSVEVGTGLTYVAGIYKEIDLEYDHGTVIINGVRRQVQLNEYNGDNILSSINYGIGGGFGFNGYIHSVRVYNYDD